MHKQLQGGKKELVALSSHRNGGVVERKNVVQLPILGHECLAKCSNHAGKNNLDALLIPMEALLLAPKAFLGDEPGRLLVVTCTD
ncbi:hypothetical protein CYMTET_21768 [Cymbomonas tetramitiformis]|uniref:Uncharacterized protein n=1 Tax=Cymbomonas tetramitiformis TaxID=36881 RepID=A0AAE0L2K6_9CHLO|nr:hypothetical protein CYMTET_21768 [Cymbomonas tetramitiformis]